MTTHPLQLGILSFTSYLEDGVDARDSLEDGIALVRHAEELGLDGAWLRVRHFERALTGAFPFLAALARETSRIRIGTAVVPMAGESPVRLAEDAATVDLLSGGRLELGVSGGILGGNPALTEAIETAYGHGDTVDGAPRSAWVLRRFLLGISGAELASVSDDVRLQFTHAGEGLRIHPHSPRLPERIWYGSGTTASAERAARLGLNLQLSTINTETHAAGVAQQQAETLDAYHAALDPTALGLADPRPREVSISRYVLAWTDDAERERLLAAAERHIPGVTERFGEGWKVGSVDEVVEQLATDPAIVRARELFPTTLLANLPSQLGPELTHRLVEVLATQVAPRLGWAPAH